MLLKLKQGKQNEIICKAIDKAGSERKMCKAAGIPYGSLYRYKFELSNIPKDRLLNIIKLLNLDINKYKNNILKELPDNWGQAKGGINCVNKKIANGTLENEINRLRLISSRRMKQWHKQMKENFPKEYYIKQYEKFKMIDGGYKHRLSNGILVRNKLEKEVGDFLISHNIYFEYEPYLNIKGKSYFPDFKVNNIIIEVTKWKNPINEKLNKLKNKIRDYEKQGFSTVFFIPEKVRKFYKEIEDFIISDLERLKCCLDSSDAQV